MPKHLQQRLGLGLLRSLDHGWHVRGIGDLLDKGLGDVDRFDTGILIRQFELRDDGQKCRKWRGKEWRPRRASG